jgi:xanthine dehydrogenase molybdopterin-binding subunit B
VLTVQHTVASTLGLPFNRVQVFVKRVGCSYGGKMARFIGATCAAALGAQLTGRPVRCHLTRDEDNRITGQRGEFRGHYRLGVTDGKITGAHYQLYKNAGWNSDASPDIMATTMIHLDAAYEFPTFHTQGEVLKTNTPSNTAFRAYGAPPGMTITENMLYDACVELSLDPLQFRRDNLQKPGYVTHFGQEMEETDVTMAACMDEVVARTDYNNLRQRVEEFNLNNTWRKRGVYLIPNKYGLGMPQMFSQGFALVHVFLDGSVMINHAGVECGQGLHTKMLQIVATELGIPMSRITVSDSANDKVPNPIPTGGSSTADLNGNALKDACKQIMDRLASFRAANEKAPWEMLVGMAFASRVNLSSYGYYSVPGDRGFFDQATKKGRRWWYYTVGAACSVVEIDVLTGEHTLLSTDLVMDVGQAINPALDIANIEASFMQGYGWISMEDTTFSAEGKLLTRGHDEYNVPCIADCPERFNVTLLKSESRQHILYSSKGIGEPPFFNGVSVYFAIKEAVRAARRDAGLTGKFTLRLPATPENVLESCARSPIV